MIWLRIFIRLAPVFVGVLRISLICLRFVFEYGAFAFVLLSVVVVVCACSLPFAFVCLLPCGLALVCIVCYWAVRPQSYLKVFHAVSQVVTNRWRIHRLWL